MKDKTKEQESEAREARRKIKGRGKMKDKKGKKMRLCCSKGIREDCECYQEGMKREKKRILKIYIDRRIIDLKIMADKTKLPERYEFYARISELKELRRMIKEQEK